ncbi:MAG TPA: LapA family protein [Thermoleophilia bacterium]|nr:LapA family protein [Thermoleophilia bacterium]
MTDDPASRDPRPSRRADQRRPGERPERRPDERSIARYPDERYRDERYPDERPPDDRHTGLRRPADPRRTVLLVVAVVVVLGFLVFWIQNHYRVSISYLTVEIRAPLWLVVSGYFLIGILIGVLLTIYYQRRRP